MERFLMIIREDMKVRKSLTPEDYGNRIGRMIPWIESLTRSGNYLTSEPLDNVGKYISKDYVLSDGPFIESKEVISGYMLIQAEDLEKASALIETCPMVLDGEAIIELRPIRQKSWD